MEEKKGIIFDLDGTLWDTVEQVVPAWNSVLSSYKDIIITTADMRSFMGKTIDKIAELIFKEMASEERIKILKECCKEERKYLEKHGGTLYKELENTLRLLGKTYSLYIVSNCQDGYVQAFLNYHKLGNYFEDIEMSGRTGKQKGENIKLIIERNKIKKAVYVGDTIGDLEAAEYAKIPFIYAKYGFGKVDKATYSIKNISELSQVLESMHMTLDIDIRKANKEALNSIISILNKVTLDLHKKGINQWIYPWKYKKIEEDIANTYIITVKEKIIGTFSLKSMETNLMPSINKTNKLYLYRIAILPEYQGNNIGVKVINYAINISSKLEKELYLDCFAGNLKLRNFYAQAGFEYCGDFPEEDYEISVFKYK